MRNTLVIVLCSLLACSAHAAVVLDGSIGSGQSGQVVPSGNGFTYDITEGLGEVQSGNLFHSFHQFIVPDGESANFSGSPGIINVIARVTGGDPTQIYGALSSTILGADIWLVNPAGTIIGDGASLDMAGTLVLSSADAVLFEDGVEFLASLNGPTTLTAANPVAFGFLSSFPNAVSVGAADIAVPTDEVFAVFAGDVSMTGTHIAGGVVIRGGVIALEDSTIDAATGDVSIVGDEVELAGADVQTFTNSAVDGGDITLSGTTSVSLDNSRLLTLSTSSSARSGTITIEGPSVMLSSTDVGTDSFGFGGGINIAGDDVLMSSSRIRSVADLAADPIAITGGRIRLQSPSAAPLGNSISAESFFGDSADIVITGTSLESDAAFDVFQTGTADFDGTGGDIVMDVGTLTLVGDSVATNLLVGTPGDVVLVADSIALTDTAVSTGAVFGFGGDIAIGTPDLSLTRSSVLSAAGGNVVVVVGAARILDESSIGTLSTSSIPAGDLFIQATSIDLAGFSSLSARAGGLADAGDITIITDRLSARDNSSIGTEQLNESSSGTSGDIAISAQSIDLDNAFISAFTISLGDAGDIAINTRSLTLSNHGAVISFTNGLGAGGTIIVVADLVSLETSSTIDAGTDGPGLGGGIVISTRALDVFSESTVSSNVRGDGQGGDINVFADEIRLDDGFITTRTVALGNAGGITLDFGSLSMNASAISADTFGGGAAGGILLVGGDIDVASTSSISTATRIPTNCPVGVCVGTGGAGGNIDLRFDSLELSGDSVVTAATNSAGNSGTISLIGNSFTADGSSITSESSGLMPDAGAAGSIQVGATHVSLTDTSVTAATSSDNLANPLASILFVVPGELTLEGSTIAATAHGAVSGGAIDVAARTIRLDDASRITSEATGAGNSGSIDLLAETRVDLTDGSAVRTNSAISQGGDISIVTIGSEIVIDRSTVEASAGAQGSGGDIFLGTDTLLLRKSGVLAQADAGNGGQIDLDTDILLEDFESLISADSNTGNAGTVNVSAPDDDVSAAVTPQNENLIAAPTVAAGPCAPEVRRTQSSLVFATKGGTRRAPDDFLLSALPLPDEQPGQKVLDVATVASVTCGAALQ